MLGKAHAMKPPNTGLTCEELRRRFPTMPEKTVQMNAIDGFATFKPQDALPTLFLHPNQKAEFERVFPGIGPIIETQPIPTPAQPGRAPRVRQHRGPQMNQTETAFLAQLRSMTPPTAVIRYNAIRFELANNLHFKPDFTVDLLTVYEAKGLWASRDAFVRLKMAARLYPELRWHLATGKRDRKTKVWHFDVQLILP